MVYQKYTLGFIRCPETNQVLLLNREKLPWMGRWNGVGGKLDADETPLQCIVRETFEETGLKIDSYIDRGVMLWNVDGEDRGGVHLFTADISQQQLEKYPTPIRYCHEGVLDWKHLDWVLHEENTGVVDNIKIMFQNVFGALLKAVFTSKYSDKVLISFVYYPQGLGTN